MQKFFVFIKKPLDLFLRLSLKKKLIVAVAAVIILVLLNQTVFKKKDDGYVTEEAKLATVIQTVSETGNVDAGGAIDVISPSTGIVEEIFVANGQNISLGDTLFKVESTATEQEQQAAYSNYLTAATTLNAAKSTAHTLRSAMLSKWKTFYDLATSSTYEEDDGTPKNDARAAVEFNTAQDDWLAAEKKLKDQQTAIAQGQADVSSKLILYQATQNAEVKATANGTIANLAIARNGNVVVSDVVLIILPQEEAQFVNVAINEIDIPKIKAGQKALVEIDALEDEVNEGEVVRVDSVGTNTQGVITYNVYIKLGNINPKIKAEMTTNVEIQTETIENTLSVPNSAVKLYQGGRAVQVLENGEPKYIPVRIGIRGNERTQILEGIAEGQEVIVGAKNELIERESPFGF